MLFFIKIGQIHSLKLNPQLLYKKENSDFIGIFFVIVMDYGVIFFYFFVSWESRRWEIKKKKKIGESNWKRWKTLDCERFGRLPRKYFSRDPSRPAKFGSKFLRKLIGDLLVVGKLFKEIVRSISTFFSLSLSLYEPCYLYRESVHLHINIRIKREREREEKLVLRLFYNS